MTRRLRNPEDFTGWFPVILGVVAFSVLFVLVVLVIEVTR